MPFKPTENEEEYILRMEFEKRKKAEEEKGKRLAKDEREKLRELHHMKCPKCGMGLVELGFRGIRIDKCSGCEGIFLDNGELETILKLEKSVIGRLFGAFRD